MAYELYIYKYIVIFIISSYLGGFLYLLLKDINPVKGIGDLYKMFPKTIRGQHLFLITYCKLLKLSRMSFDKKVKIVTKDNNGNK